MAWRSPWHPSSAAAGAAGVAGIALALAWTVNGLDLYPLDLLSPFHWTADHIALIGQYDWAGLALVGVVAAGVARCRRRALRAARPRDHRRRRAAAAPGQCAGRPRPDQPGIRRSASAGPSWGIGLGLFGAMLASIVGPDVRSDLRGREPAEGPPDGLPGLRPGVRGWFPPDLRPALLHRRRLCRRHVRVQVGLGRDRRAPRDGPGRPAPACSLGVLRRARRARPRSS